MLCFIILQVQCVPGTVMYTSLPIEADTIRYRYRRTSPADQGGMAISQTSVMDGR